MLFSIMTVSVYIPINSARRFPYLFEGWLWRIDAFELWCWRRLLRVPWIARRSNQSIPKEINPEYSLEGLMLKLKCQYFGPLRQRANWMEKTLMLGKIEGSKRRGQQKMRWLDSITNSTIMSFCKLQTIVKNWEAWPAAVHWVAKCRTSLLTEPQQQCHRGFFLCFPLRVLGFMVLHLDL